jgi:potassium-transporting ATPase KdpC subunit
MLSEIPTAFRMLLLFTMLTGLVYPGIVTALSQGFFRHQANGSLIIREGRVLGSELIGQNFTRPEYLHPRPSDAGVNGYDAGSSGASNLGPTSERLARRVGAAAENFRRENPDFRGPIPSDLLTSSGSGLDPHLSPASAAAQVPRIARVRGVSQDQVRSLVAQYTENPDLGLLGEHRVNVLLVNIALDERFPLKKP